MLAPGSFMPGLAAKAPTGILQEGGQLAGDFTFACVLYMKGFIPKKQKKPGKYCLSFEGGTFLCGVKLPT